MMRERGLGRYFHSTGVYVVDKKRTEFFESATQKYPVEYESSNARHEFENWKAEAEAKRKKMAASISNIP